MWTERHRMQVMWLDSVRHRPVGQQHRLAQGLLEMQILRPSALPTQNL